MKRLMSAFLLAFVAVALVSLLLPGIPGTWTRAEPYLAVREGKKCIVCHVNPSGGGKRTEFGNIYVQTELSAKFVRPAPPALPAASNDTEGDFDGDGEADGSALAAAFDSGPSLFWNGEISDRLAIGGDVRSRVHFSSVPNEPDPFSLKFDEAILYTELAIVPDRLLFYVDGMVAPSLLNREAWVLLRGASGNAYLKAGKMFLPYGFRLEDDSAFIRQFTGVNYNAWDVGVEGGFDWNAWSVNLAITNGTGGAAETDTGKQYSLRVAHVRPGWRAGASWNFNDAGADEREMANVFAGFRTGRITWLGEVDLIRDESLAGGMAGTSGRKMFALWGEANVLLAKGHNFKVTYEYVDPDRDIDEDQRSRFSVQWEVFPTQFTQFRLGVRINDGIPQNNQWNATDVFLELHVFF